MIVYDYYPLFVFCQWAHKFLPSATVVMERLCFHRCLFVQGGGGVYTPLQTDRHPPGRHSLGRHPPGQTSPPGRWPLQRTVHILLEYIRPFAKVFLALILWMSGSEKSLVHTKVHSSTPWVYKVRAGEQSEALIRPGSRACPSVRLYT